MFLLGFSIDAKVHVLELILAVDRAAGRAQAAFHTDLLVALAVTAVLFGIVVARVTGAHVADTIGRVGIVHRWSGHTRQFHSHE
jgi:hypothetical protein